MNYYKNIFCYLFIIIDLGWVARMTQCFHSNSLIFLFNITDDCLCFSKFLDCCILLVQTHLTDGQSGGTSDDDNLIFPEQFSHFWHTWLVK